MDDNDSKYFLAFLAMVIVALIVGVTVVETAKIKSSPPECTATE